MAKKRNKKITATDYYYIDTDYVKNIYKLSFEDEEVKEVEYCISRASEWVDQLTGFKIGKTINLPDWTNPSTKEVISAETRAELVMRCTAILTDQIYKNDYDFGNGSISVNLGGLGASQTKIGGKTIDIPPIIFDLLTEAGLYQKATPATIAIGKCGSDTNNFWTIYPPERPVYLTKDQADEFYSPKLRAGDNITLSLFNENDTSYITISANLNYDLVENMLTNKLNLINHNITQLNNNKLDKPNFWDNLTTQEIKEKLKISINVDDFAKNDLSNLITKLPEGSYALKSDGAKLELILLDNSSDFANKTLTNLDILGNNNSFYVISKNELGKSELKIINDFFLNVDAQSWPLNVAWKTKSDVMAPFYNQETKKIEWYNISKQFGEVFAKDIKTLQDELKKIIAELALKQNINDNDLQTTSKKVSGAINELKNNIDNLPKPPKCKKWSLFYSFEEEATDFQNEIKNGSRVIDIEKIMPFADFIKKNWRITIFSRTNLWIRAPRMIYQETFYGDEYFVEGTILTEQFPWDTKDYNGIGHAGTEKSKPFSFFGLDNGTMLPDKFGNMNARLYFSFNGNNWGNEQNSLVLTAKVLSENGLSNFFRDGRYITLLEIEEEVECPTLQTTFKLKTQETAITEIKEIVTTLPEAKVPTTITFEVDSSWDILVNTSITIPEVNNYKFKLRTATNPNNRQATIRSEAPNQAEQNQSTIILRDNLVLENITIFPAKVKKTDGTFILMKGVKVEGDGEVRQCILANAEFSEWKASQFYAKSLDYLIQNKQALANWYVGNFNKREAFYINAECLYIACPFGSNGVITNKITNFKSSFNVIVGGASTISNGAGLTNPFSVGTTTYNTEWDKVDYSPSRDFGFFNTWFVASAIRIQQPPFKNTAPEGQPLWARQIPKVPFFENCDFVAQGYSQATLMDATIRRIMLFVVGSFDTFNSPVIPQYISTFLSSTNLLGNKFQFPVATPILTDEATNHDFTYNGKEVSSSIVEIKYAVKKNEK